MEQQQNRTPDPMVQFRSVKRGKNSKGGDRTELYVNKEEVMALLATLADYADNERGVKFDLHISERQSDDGRKFDGGCMFVKKVQEKDATGGRPGRDINALTDRVAKIKEGLKPKTTT